MLMFLVIIGVCLAVTAGWAVSSYRKRHGARAGQASLIQTQARAVHLQEHSTGTAYGLLLKAAHGDRSQVEKWVSVEQYRGQSPVSRDEAIELLARRLQSAKQTTAAE